MLFRVFMLLSLYAASVYGQDLVCGFDLAGEDVSGMSAPREDIDFYRGVDPNRPEPVHVLPLVGKLRDVENGIDFNQLYGRTRAANDRQSITDLFNPSHTGSLPHFFNAMSYGKLSFETHNRATVAKEVYVSSTTETTLAAYGLSTAADCRGGDDRGVRGWRDAVKAFALDVVRAADDDIDFNNYDGDGDGKVDLVAVLTPREFGQLCKVNGTAFYRLRHSTNDPIANDPTKVVTVETIITGDQTDSFPSLVGILAHEYGHVMGLPELYDRTNIRVSRTDYDNHSAGVGFWGVMGKGIVGYVEQAGVPDGPAPMSAWSRIKVGWLDSRVNTVSSDQDDVTIPDINSSTGNVVVQIPVPGSPDPPTEYFLLSNRQNTYDGTMSSIGSYYDAHAPTSGLLIWHIDEEVTPHRPIIPQRDPLIQNPYSASDVNAIEEHKRVDVECADGLFTGLTADTETGRDDLDNWSTSSSHTGNLGDAADVWTPSKEFTPDSNPSTAGYSNNGTSKGYSRYTDDKQDMFTGIAVRNIQALSGGVMQVDIVFLPLEPRNLRAEAGAGQVTLRWDAPMPNGGSAITGYKYRQSADEGRTWTAETSVAGGSTARSQTVGTLTAGTRYTFEVRAVNAAGSGAWASATATPVLSPPTATATAGYRRIHVDWLPVASATGYDVQVQRRFYDGGTWPATWSSLATNSPGRPRGTSRRYAHTGVSPDSLYRYQMRSRVGAVVSAWSAPTAGVQPGVGSPEGFSAEAGASQVTLRWTGPDHASITKWRYRDVTALGGRTQGGWQDAAVSGSASTEWSAPVADLTPGQAYRFQVRAVNGAGGGQPSAVSNAVTPWLARPTGGSVSKVAGPALEVAWSPVASATGYEVQGQRRFYEGGAWPATWTQQQANGAQPYVHRGVDADSLYRYRVRARMGAVGSAWSDMLPGVGGVQPPPSAPTGLTATAGNRQVTLTWTGPTHTSITGWQYQRGHISEPTTAWSGWLPLSSAATTRTFTVTSALSNGRSYVFQVRAGNAGGWSAAAQSDTVLLVRPADTPGRVALSTTAPQVGDDLTATLIDPDAPSNAGFSWAYLVPAGASGANGEVSSSRTSLSSTLQVSTVLLGVRLLSKVSYTDDHGPQQAVSDTTAAVVGPPWAPRTFTATAGDGQVALSWKVPSKIGGSAITRYAYRYKKTSDSWSDSWTSVGTSTSATVPDLTNGTPYSFEVRAVNEYGDGTAASASATPQAPPNRAPTVEGPTSASIAENSPTSNSLGTYTARDEDGDELTWSWTGTDADAFELKEPTPQGTHPSRTLHLVSAPNYEAKNKYTVWVKVADAALADSTMVSVSVSDVNEAPIFTRKGPESVEVTENSPTSKSLGTYAARDEDGDLLTWNVTSTGRDAFSFELKHGAGSTRTNPVSELRFRNPPNYEAKSLYQITVQAVSRGPLLVRQDVTVEVTNQEEAGSVTLAPDPPQVGKKLIATLKDDDGRIVVNRWSWERFPESFGATGASGLATGEYTPGAGEVGQYVRVTVYYSDGHGENKQAQSAQTSAIVDVPGVPQFGQAS